jgi:hypothetical protein
MGLLLAQPEFQLHLIETERPHFEEKLERLLMALDELHTAASDGTLGALTSLSRQELVSWLNDLIYTASETLAELADHSGEAGGFPPPLTILRRSGTDQPCK